MIGKQTVIRYLKCTHTNDARRWRRKLGDQPFGSSTTPKKKFPEVVPICDEDSPESLKDLITHQRCQTLPELRERRRHKLGDQPTPEKRFPEIVPILKECGKSCVEGSPESLKDLIHIAHAFEDQKRCCLQTAFGTIRRQCGHSRNLLYTSLQQESNNQAGRQARWTVPAENDRQAHCPQVLDFYIH